jgi:hypothetical protein
MTATREVFRAASCCLEEAVAAERARLEKPLLTNREEVGWSLCCAWCWAARAQREDAAAEECPQEDTRRDLPLGGTMNFILYK